MVLPPVSVLPVIAVGIPAMAVGHAIAIQAVEAVPPPKALPPAAEETLATGLRLVMDI
jgi:hypothetical protein